MRAAIFCSNTDSCQTAKERDTRIRASAFIGPELFAGCEPGKFPLLPLLRRAIAQRALSGELHQGRWYDIGTPERLAALDAQLSSARFRREA